MQPAVYLLATTCDGPLRTGVTHDLVQQAWTWRTERGPGPASPPDAHRIVYYELHATMDRALLREQRIRDWNHSWKVRLIEERNPGWIDLWDEIVAGPESRPAPI